MFSRIPGLDKIVRAGATARTYLGLGTGDSPVFAGLDVNGGELVLDADGDTSITADTDDQIDIKIAGADDFQMTANTFSVLSGSTLNIDSGATIANSGTATGFGGGGLASGDVIPADDGSVGAPGLSFADDTDNGLYRIGADNFGVAVAGALAMEFDPTGAALLPLQPIFLSRLSGTASNVTGNATNYVFAGSAEDLDQGSNVASGVYTAPVTGRHLFWGSIRLSGMTSVDKIALWLEESDSTDIVFLTDQRSSGNLGAEAIVPFISLLSLSASDTVRLNINVNGEGADTVDVVGGALSVGGSHFCGMLLPA